MAQQNRPHYCERHHTWLYSPDEVTAHVRAAHRPGDAAPVQWAKCYDCDSWMPFAQILTHPCDAADARRAAWVAAWRWKIRLAGALLVAAFLIWLIRMMG